MLTIEQIRTALKERSLTKVMLATNINRTTLWQIRQGKHTNPTLDTLTKLSEYLAPDHQRKGGNDE